MQPAPQSKLHSALRADIIDWKKILVLILAGVAPATVVLGIFPTALAVTGQPGIAIGSIAVGVVLLVFAPGYLAMASRIRNAGAFYAFARVLGRPVAVAVALVALVTYLFFQTGSYGGLAAVGTPLLSEWIGIDVPWWIVAVVAWGLVAALGLFDISTSTKVLIVLVAAETLMVAVYSLTLVFSPGFEWNLQPLALDNLWSPGAGTLAALGMTCFAGLEATAAYAEEARDARRSVSKAMFTMIIGAMLFYSFAAVVMISAAGSDVYELAASEGPALLPGLAAAQLGDWTVNFGFALFATSVFAAAVAFHSLIARYGYALGREGVLPRAFGLTVNGAPRNASIAQSIIGLVSIVAFAVAGWDPLTQVFFIFGTSGGFGVAVLITITALAVIVYFAKNPGDETLWRRAVAPWIALPILLLLTVLMTTNLPTLYGTAGWTGPSVFVPALLAGVAVIGLIWGLVLRSKNPEVYEGIGLGSGNLSTMSAGSGDQDRIGAHR